jgi:outer membrane protein TolC
MNIINKHLNKSPLIIIFFVYNIVFCQDINYDRIILPNNAENINLKERLVQLAWQNNPINKIQNNNVNIAKRNIKLERYGWLGNIRITANINEFVINPARDEFNRAQFFPLYNIGASIPLNIFLSNPQEIISAKLLHENEKYSLNQLKLETRS